MQRKGIPSLEDFFFSPMVETGMVMKLLNTVPFKQF